MGTVQAGCTYNWCGCGMARTEQPLCDFACQNLYLKRILKGGPVKYVAPETKDVWFCNCKQTKSKPFCDGSRKRYSNTGLSVQGSFGSQEKVKQNNEILLGF